MASTGKLRDLPDAAQIAADGALDPDGIVDALGELAEDLVGLRGPNVTP